MRILYLTQWFEPEPAFKGAEFARALADEGFDVEVVTGFPNYPGGRLYPDYKLKPYHRDRTLSGLILHRLFLYPSHDQSSLGRMLNYLSFFLSSLIFGIVRGGRYDLVYVYHPPITPALAMTLAAKIHRFRLVLDIQDLWPDSVDASGMASARTVGVLERICRFVYRAADQIVVQAEGMRGKLLERGVEAAKISRIYNWATYTSASESRTREHPAYFADGINVVYGGNLGQAQALGHVIDAFAIAKKQVPDLRLHLFGDGIERDALVQKAQRDPDAGVSIHDPVGRKEMDRIFEQADILIMHLKDDPLYEFTIPSKTQHYLACGKPILAGVSGEAAAILKQSGGAIVCPSENERAMATGLIKLGQMNQSDREAMGRRARDYYHAHFTMKSAIERTVAAFGCAKPSKVDRPPYDHEIATGSGKR
jgi:glycosyltransferase involved in cell wall biosynthesis